MYNTAQHIVQEANSQCTHFPRSASSLSLGGNTSTLLFLFLFFVDVAAIFKLNQLPVYVDSSTAVSKLMPISVLLKQLEEAQRNSVVFSEQGSSSQLARPGRIRLPATPGLSWQLKRKTERLILHRAREKWLSFYEYRTPTCSTYISVSTVWRSSILGNKTLRLKALQSGRKGLTNWLQAPLGGPL